MGYFDLCALVPRKKFVTNKRSVIKTLPVFFYESKKFMAEERTILKQWVVL
jgi:hypothetical protein